MAMVCTHASDVIEMALERLGPDDWQALREISVTDNLWHRFEWWHNKYYEENPPNDGTSVQQPKKGASEVPYLRELFHPSPFSRFSLGSEGRVAYFSSDFGVNCCETIEQFSQNPQLTFEELALYLGGYGNPTPGWRGYPLNFHLALGAVVLNAASANAPFFKLVSHRAGAVDAALRGIVVSREEECKLSTQRISSKAKEYGFDGIVYQSVRVPTDITMPKWNLVMFAPEKVRKGMPPNPYEAPARQGVDAP